MYHVYMLASDRHGTLYVGVTNSMLNRLEQHRVGNGSAFVAKYKVHRLLSSRINFPDRGDGSRPSPGRRESSFTRPSCRATCGTR
ncbi:GIY-YIG nuclease family protein [Afipia massiliensis]|uniref:GIY-YIG nuclease family protein n=1 Tax=Afipia massiliensis TaxID=211460 RepID=UPI001619DEB2